MKCFERLVKDHITSTLPDTLDSFPQGCVLSPLLYSLFTHDVTAYREEVRALGVLCQENNLTLNVNITK